MIRRAAYVLCAVIWLVPFAAHASPLVTYTWETLSSQPHPAMPPLSLSFTVDGNVAVNADSSFAPPSFPPTPFPFPPTLLAFNLDVGALSIALNSFTSGVAPPGGNPNFPNWIFELDANPAALTADLSLFFYDSIEANEITHGQASTGTVGSIAYVSDDEGTGCFFNNPPAECVFTGILVPSVAVPEPPSLWILIAAMFGLVIAGGQFRRRSIT